MTLSYIRHISILQNSNPSFTTVNSDRYACFRNIRSLSFLGGHLVRRHSSENFNVNASQNYPANNSCLSFEQLKLLKWQRRESQSPSATKDYQHESQCYS